MQVVSLDGLISELAIKAKMKRTVDKINLDTCCSQRVSLGNESSTGIYHPLSPIGGVSSINQLAPLA